MIKYLKRKYALSSQGAKDYVKAVVAGVAVNLVKMAPAGILFMLVADLLGEQSYPVWAYACGIAGILIIMYITDYVQYNCDFLNTYKESAVRRITLAERMRKLPLSYFGKRDLSDLTTRIMRDCATIESAFSHFYPQFTASFISTVVIAVGLIAYNWRMGLAAVWVLPISILIVALSGRAQNKFNKRKLQADLATTEGIQEYLECMRDLRSCNASDRYLQGLGGKIDKAESRHIAAELGVAVFVVSAQLLLKFGIVTTALAGGVLLANGQLTALTFFMYLMVVSRVYDPMGNSLQNLAAIISCRVNIGRMQEIYSTPLQEGSKNFFPANYNVTFDNVRFAYNEGEQVLDGVSFTANQGEITALIGPSGGGKSTVAKLAARFWDIQGGKITVGGEDISQVDPETLLSGFSIVFQDVTLFNNSVKENIRIGRKGATDEEVMAAAEAAQCTEFINRLPHGMDTNIGENGSKLSGGERQRISIARALLKDAPIVLLDEATASLDVENETHLQRAISRLIKDKTVLVIAHRMRTVAGADKLVVLEGGKVTEQGTPAQLEEKGGTYARMKALQSNA